MFNYACVHGEYHDCIEEFIKQGGLWREAASEGSQDVPGLAIFTVYSVEVK